MGTSGTVYANRSSYYDDMRNTSTPFYSHDVHISTNTVPISPSPGIITPLPTVNLPPLAPSSHPIMIPTVPPTTFVSSVTILPSYSSIPNPGMIHGSFTPYTYTPMQSMFHPPLVPGHIGLPVNLISPSNGSRTRIDHFETQ